MDNDDDDDDSDMDYSDAEVSRHHNEEDSMGGSEELQHGDKNANQDDDESIRCFYPGTTETTEYSNSNKESRKEETMSEPFITTTATAQSDFSTSLPQQSQLQTQSSVDAILNTRPRRSIHLSLPLQMPPLASEVSESWGANTGTAATGIITIKFNLSHAVGLQNVSTIFQSVEHFCIATVDLKEETVPKRGGIAFDGNTMVSKSRKLCRND